MITGSGDNPGTEIRLHDGRAAKAAKTKKAAIIAIAAAIALAALGCGAFAGWAVSSGGTDGQGNAGRAESAASYQTAPQPADSPERATGQASDTAASPETVPPPETVPHEHVWTETFETTTIPAVTTTAHHPDEYETVTAYDSICNDCGETVTGAEQEHVERTGHSGWTEQVAHKVPRLVKAAWDETVIVEPERTEKTHTGWICELCGENRP